MKFIAKYLSEYKCISILAPAFKMLEAIFELLVPLVMAKMIDIGIKNGDADYILKMSLLLLFFAACGLGVAVTAQFFAALAATRSVQKMRSDLFSHIMHFCDASMDAAGASTLITRMTNDLNQVQNGINMFLRLFLRSPFIVLGATVMAFVIDARAAAIFVGVIIVLSLFVGLIMRSTLPMFRTIQATLDALLLRVSENLEGIRVIRAFHTGEREREKFLEWTNELYDRQIRAGSVQALLNPLTYVTVNLGVIALLWYASQRVDAGLLLQGEVVALCNYMSQILVELVKFANLITLVTRGLASAARVEGIMKMKADEREHLGEASDMAADDTPKDSVAGAMPGRRSSDGADRSNGAAVPAIEFKDVTFTYGEGRDATLEHISFTIGEGQTLGIIGGTGAGKSTIARLIRHAYDADKGQVLLFGKDVRSYSDEKVADIVANVPQKAVLLAGDIAGNLRLGNPDATDEELWDALGRAQAKDFVEGRKGQLYGEVKKGGANFSGGQRQRLTIARALCIGAPVLILDDSASALDLATESRLKAALDGMTDVTKVIISQRASSVKNADKILVIEDGWCVGDGTHEELLKKCEVYREIYYAQYPESE